MPTLIMLDCSLSMLQPVTKGASEESGDVEQVFHLAKHGLDLLLEHIQNNFRMEQVALLAFASQCELVCPYTRDIPRIRQLLAELDCFDKTNLMSAMRGAANVVEEHWGTSIPNNVIIVTDGGLGNGLDSLTHFFANPGYPDYANLLPYRFKGNLSIVSLTTGEELKTIKPILERLADKTGLKGSVMACNEAELSKSAVESLFQTLIDEQYREFCGILKFGDEMNCPVTLCPPPTTPYKVVNDFESVEAHLSEELDIKGFFTLADLASPPVMSRHLILPVGKANNFDEETRQANLCVFLHGAMKVESMAALVQVGVNWFGILFSCSDTKKKSNLMLALFEPGPTPVPWLGDLTTLGPLADLTATNQEPFPIKGDQKPSYSYSPVVWIRSASLQSDIQKILRHARKMPEKVLHFFKELNRLKRHALAIGFQDLLENLADTLEREMDHLSTTAHPESVSQLKHAARQLRSEQAREFDHVIQPLT